MNLEKLKLWYKQLSTVELKYVFEEAALSRSYLHMVLSGKRTLSAEKAGRLADVSLFLCRNSNRKLPLLTREDLCSACARCPYTKKG